MKLNLNKTKYKNLKNKITYPFNYKIWMQLIQKHYIFNQDNKSDVKNQFYQKLNHINIKACQDITLLIIFNSIKIKKI